MIKRKKVIIISIVCSLLVLMGLGISRLRKTNEMRIVVEEYPINEDVATEIVGSFDNSFDQVAGRLPPEILKKREKWRKVLPFEEKVKDIEYINRKLKPLGYKLVPEKGAYSFYKGQNLIEGLYSIYGFSMDSKEQRFVFGARKEGVTYPDCKLVCVDGNIYKEEDFGFSPAWINDELWRIKLAGIKDEGKMELYLIVNGFIDKSLLDEIVRKTTSEWVQEEIQEEKVWVPKYNLPDLPSQVIYPFFVPFGAGGESKINLRAWGKNWVLELDKDVVINGKSLGKEKGADIYGFHLIKGKPFYLFSLQKDDCEPTGDWPHIKKVRISYDGKILPVWYNWAAVRGLIKCCEGGEFYWKNENMVWFIAKRGDQWYYVEVGSYE